MWYMRVPAVFRHTLLARFSSSSAGPVYDVVVAGGGMVGTSMAAALGHSPAFKGKKILLLEAAPALKPLSAACRSESRSSRVVALSPRSIKLLESFGAWQHIVNTKRLCPVKQMHVWDACSNAAISFDSDSHSSDLACIVENDVLVGAICEQLKPVADCVELRLKTKVQSFGSVFGGEPWLKVALEDGSELRTRLLVGADGFNSLIRRTAGIDTIGWDYDQQAVVAVLSLDTEPNDGHNDTAWQRFLPNGPLALLPLSTSQSCMIWTTSPEEAKQLLSLSEEEFVDSVNHALWTDEAKDSLTGYVENWMDSLIQTGSSLGLGLFTPNTRQLPPSIVGVAPSSRASFPLGLCHSKRYVERRVALIGDAAHRLHPLAGQGVNLGFGDVEILRDQLTNAVLSGSDVGSSRHLRLYERERMLRVMPMMGVVDVLNRVYSNNLSPAVLVRSAICKTLNSVKPLNASLVKFASL